jgi:hypothetical protein
MKHYGSQNFNMTPKKKKKKKKKNYLINKYI